MKQRFEDGQALHGARTQDMLNRPGPDRMDVDSGPSRHSSDAMDTSD